MYKIKNSILRIPSTAGMIFAFIGLLILALFFSFGFFALGYWLITLILMGFFGFFLPFSWGYALGAWLIALILGLFILPSNFVRISSE